MTKVDIEIHNNVLDIYNKIKDIDDSGIEIDIPEGSVLFDNTLNIKLLKRIVQRDDKEITLTTKDKKGKVLIDIVEENVTLETDPYVSYEPKKDFFDKFKNIKVPKISLPNINLPKAGIIIPIVLLTIIFGSGYVIIQKMHTTSVKIVVEAQTLSRSITVNVKKNESNDFTKNVLKGIEIQKTIQNSMTAPATGEKTVGTAAKGEITIYNKTATEKEFKKGQIVIYEDDDKEYKYKLTGDVKVPARTESLTDPSAPIVPGEKTVNIEAIEIGEDYNISKDRTLDVDKQASTDFVAKATTTISGGKKEVKKAIAQADIDGLKTAITTKNKEEAQKELEKSNSSVSKYIKGSEDITVLKENFSGKVGDEATVVTLDQTVTATGLSYTQSDLDSLIAAALKNLIPEGYAISNQDKQIKVDVLGNATNTVLNKSQADLQVTIKIFIVPFIEETKLKEELKGKSIEEGEKLINNINNLKTYEISTVPNISLFQKFPKDITKIEIKVEKE